MVVAVRAKSQITLPNKTVKSLGIKEGDEYEVVGREDGSILLVPVVTYPKAYVDKLVKEFEKTSEKIDKGEWPVFSSVDEMMNYLESTDGV